ncbi:hypothetical protein ACFFYR_10480 [Paraburkholderia dipogonis]|uniref:hypothetical protein n=1 Tax=Paraburkholderia dipogonis TaxID=1211383 RepID=UPI0035ED1621
MVLPEDLVPDGTGNPLAKSEAFVNCTCPDLRRRGQTRNRHDGHFRRFRLGTSTAMRRRMAKTMVDERTDYWAPMDQYIGGIEHAILHSCTRASGRR